MAQADLGAVLADYIAARTGAASARVVEFHRLSGGAIQENHALTLELDGGSLPGRQDFVVRRDAASRIAASLTRPQEFAVLSAAHAAGVAAPKPYWLCTDPAVLGTDFYVMARAHGVSSGRTLTSGALDAGQARSLTRQLGEQLARLHRLRPPQPGLDFLQPPRGHPAAARVAQYRAALDHIPEPHPALEWALGWLLRHAPPTGELALCHGDFRTGNYMVDGERVTAILDWEFASWSDPCEDLGWLCARSWRFAAKDKEVGGIGEKADLFDSYARVSGQAVDPARVAYWEAMAMTRWAVIALQQAQRHLSGEEPSLELALTGRMLPEIEMDLLDHIHALEATR